MAVCGQQDENAVLLLRTGKEYIVAALLTNSNTCLCGSLTIDYFGIAPSTLEEYERLLSTHVRGTASEEAQPGDKFSQSANLFPFNSIVKCGHKQATIAKTRTIGIRCLTRIRMQKYQDRVPAVGGGMAVND